MLLIPRTSIAGGRYIVQRQLGAGAMAEVYLVTDTHRQAPVALKMLRADLALDTAFEDYFRKEAHVMQALQHPNIVRFYEPLRDGEMFFLVLDYIDGPNLQQYLFRQKLLPIADALHIAQVLATALDYAHANGVIHRDLKPANVLLASNGTILLSDFGVARVAGSTTTTAGMVGSPAYMAPEQIRGGAMTAATDQYSLAILLWELIAGRRPFVGATPGLRDATLGERVLDEHLNYPPPSGVLPAELDLPLRNALSKRASQRFSTCTEMVQQVIRCSAAVPTTSQQWSAKILATQTPTPPPLPPGPTPGPPPPPPPPWPPVPRFVIYLAGALLLILGITFSVAYSLTGNQNPADIASQSTLAVATALTAAPADTQVPAAATAPTAVPAPAAAEVAAPAAYKACVAFDTGGLGDKGFNDLAMKGLDDAKAAGYDTAYAEAQGATDYAGNIQRLIDEGCQTIVTVGFTQGEATVAATLANPEINFGQVDATWPEAGADFTPGTADDLPYPPNFTGLDFQIDQASMLAGYLAAGFSKTGKIGTYGGAQFPGVTRFMDGMYAGIKYYNEKNKAKVKLLGWDAAKQTGTFVGGDNPWGDPAKGEQLAQAFMDQGADIVHPIAGGTGNGTIKAMLAAGKYAIGVDTDQAISLPEYTRALMTSAQKAIDVAVLDLIKKNDGGDSGGENYIGTLANNGVAMAPFHDFEGKFAADLVAAVDALKADIASGKVKVADYMTSTQKSAPTDNPQPTATTATIRVTTGTKDLGGGEYVGELSDGMANGQGTMTYASGGQYTGEFKNDKFDGQGTWVMPNCCTYIGNFKDDMFNGQGAITFVAGESYTGGFKNGQYDGEGTYIWGGGKSYTRMWKDGLPLP